MRPLLIEAAARRKRIEQRFVDRLESARFDEVILPILDYVDPYATVVSPEAARHAYRFTDRNGDLVALRSDFTPMVARALAPSLTGETLRVYYRGDVIRTNATRLGANREMFQIGAEIIGDDSIEADIEILQLVGELATNAMVVFSAPADRVGAIVSKLGDGFSLDETGEASSYYTGVRFSVYANATRKKIAQGGRYDTLYERFGAAAPAIGFTFTIDDLD